MNQKLINVVMFATGAAIGSLVTWKIVQARYERILQEEIESVKDTWSRMAREDSEEYDANDDIEDDASDADEDDYEDPSIVEYHRIVDRYKSSGKDAETVEEGEGDDEVPYVNGPVVIEPEKFGDGNYDHELHSLTYYRDGVLATDWLEVLDLDDTIGEDAINHFGDYTEDVVHVRNERLHADYEVVKDPRNYADVLANNNSSLMHMHAD